VGIAVLWAVWRYLPDSRRGHSQLRPDIPGMFISGIALVTLAFAIIEGGHNGWNSTLVVTSFGVAAIASITLVWWECRTEHPMIPLTVFRDRGFVAGTLAMVVFNLAYGGIGLPLTVYLQDGRNMSASAAGRVMLPLAIGIAVAAPLAGRWSNRVGPARMMTAGFLLAGSSLLATAVTIGQPVGVTAGLFSIAGAGVGMTVSQANTIPMRSVAPELASRASGALNLARLSAMTLSIAIVPTMFHAAAGISGDSASQRVAGGDLARGTSVALTAAGMVLLLGASLTALLLLRPVRVDKPAQVELRSVTVGPR
jgi:DHA2 family methylenomycin A resistance protein-like MFS transporter